MKLKLKISDINTVEEAHRPLYTQQGNIWVLQVDDVVPSEDLLKEQLKVTEEIAKNKELEDKVKTLENPTPAPPSPPSINPELAAVLEKLGTLEKKIAVSESKNVEYEKKQRNENLVIILQDAAKTAKVADAVKDDIAIIGVNYFEMNAEGQVVPIKGTDLPVDSTPDKWLAKVKEDKSKPHWFGTSAGGGAGGNTDQPTAKVNPFTAKNWNITEQSGIILGQGMEAAEKLATEAGTTVGGAIPAQAA